MVRNILQIIIAIIVLGALPTYAGENHHKGTIIHLSETNSVQVQEDMLLAQLKFISKSDSSVDLQNKINRAMIIAFGIIEKYEDIEVTSKNYSVYQRYNRHNNTEKEEWHGHQSIELRSIDDKNLLKLVGELQESGLTVDKLGHQLSPQTRERAYNSLIEPTIAKLSEKAQKITQSLNKEDFEFLTMNIDSGFVPNPYNIQKMKSSDMQPPISALGISSVSLTINTKILIKD